MGQLLPPSLPVPLRSPLRTAVLAVATWPAVLASQAKVAAHATGRFAWWGGLPWSQLTARQAKPPLSAA